MMQKQQLLSLGHSKGTTFNGSSISGDVGGNIGGGGTSRGSNLPKYATFGLCVVNVAVCLYLGIVLLQPLYFSISDSFDDYKSSTSQELLSSNDMTGLSSEVVELQEQIERMRRESEKIRKESIPYELIKVVSKLQNEINVHHSRSMEEMQEVRERKTEELIQRLRDKARKRAGESAEVFNVNLAAAAADLDPVIDFAEVIQNSTNIFRTEMERKLLQSTPQDCNLELHADYGGMAVVWGETHLTASAADCCRACKSFNSKRNSGAQCNIWVYCPSPIGCFSRDIYDHHHQECWLKYAENVEVIARGAIPEEVRKEYPHAPDLVPWVSGTVKL